MVFTRGNKIVISYWLSVIGEDGEMGMGEATQVAQSDSGKIG